MSRYLPAFLCLSLLLMGCANKQLDSYVENYDSYSQKAYVIDHGIHTALVLQSLPLVNKLGLQNTFFSGYKFIEIGRGDAGFYQEEEEQFSTALKALFLSTPAILHLSAYNLPPAENFLQSVTTEIKLSDAAMEKLLDSIVSSFSLSNGRAVELAQGRNERSRFFKANGSYHMFYTCNNWTADMLQQTGYPVRHRWAFFAGSVMDQLSEIQKQLPSETD